MVVVVFMLMLLLMIKLSMIKLMKLTMNNALFVLQAARESYSSSTSFDDRFEHEHL